MHSSESPSHGRNAGSSEPGLVDAKALANVLLDWADSANIAVSPMKLQKLLYFCHAECAVLHGERLLKQEFEAWDYGPVIPSIYHEFKDTQKSSISRRALQFNPKTAKREIVYCAITGHILDAITGVFDAYASLSAEHLSNISHVYDGPWFEARHRFAAGRNMDRRISHELIVERHTLIRS